jgi:CRP-like cAMP-binding protein
MVQSKPFSANSSDPKFLAGISLFKGLANDALHSVARESKTLEKQSGEYYFFQEDPANLVYVLVHGRIRLTQVTTDGQQVNLRFITPVEAFGVIAFMSEATYPVSAEAMEDSTALAWDRQVMERLMANEPRIAINTIGILAERVKEFQDRLREMATERVERRIARALLRLVRQTGRQTPEGVLIDFPITRQDLAEMTGTTLYTVSRTLSKWESQGIVQSGRERIVVRIPHGLVAIAEDLPNPAGAAANPAD